MAEYIGLHDNGKSSVQGFMDIFSGLYGAGVANISDTNAWKVSQRGAGANMSVDIAAGRGLLADTLIHYPAWSDATVNKTITAANPSNPRRDIVVAYFDETVPSTATTNNQGALKFMVVAGTAAASPSDPTDPTIQSAVGAGNPWIKLARVSVAAAASSIVDANITDLRTTIAVQGKVNTEAIADQGVTTAKIADSNVTTGKIADAAVTGVKMEARPVDYLANFIASGGVVAQSAGLVGTFSNMVHYINGVRCTKTSVANKTYTVSKDTYVDADATNNSTVVYTEVANGAASPALSANYIRVAKVVTNGSAITSVVQYGLDTLGNAVAPKSAGKQNKVTDANGWTVYDYGTLRQYRKKGSWVASIGANSWALQGDTTNLPVGISTIGTRFVEGSASSSDSAIGTAIHSTSASTVVQFQIGNQAGATVNYTGYYSVCITES